MKLSILSILIGTLILFSFSCNSEEVLVVEEEDSYHFINLYEVENFNTNKAISKNELVEEYLVIAEENGYHLYQIVNSNGVGVGYASPGSLTVIVKRTILPESPDRKIELLTVENGIKQDVEKLGSYVYDEELIWACRMTNETEFRFNREKMAILNDWATELSNTGDIAGISKVYAAMSMMRGLYYGNHEVIKDYCKEKLLYYEKPENLN